MPELPAAAEALAFARGTRSGLALAGSPPELTLTPSLWADFGAGELPSGWYSEPMTEGGEVVPGQDGLVLQGARVGWERLSGAGRSLEFVAAYGARPHQHVGFGTDYENVPWVSVSTKYGHSVYARTNFYQPEDIRMAPSLRGEFHRYRIEWNVLDVRVFVDEREAAYLLVPIPAYMRPLLGNERVGDDPLRVRWMRMSPYNGQGTFTSAVVSRTDDRGWSRCVVTGATPDATSVTLEVRGGDSPEPDDSWSPWTPVALDGLRAGSATTGLALPGRRAQYRLGLATERDTRTPRITEVSLA